MFCVNRWKDAKDDEDSGIKNCGKVQMSGGCRFRTDYCTSCKSSNN